MKPLSLVKSESFVGKSLILDFVIEGISAAAKVLKVGAALDPVDGPA